MKKTALTEKKRNIIGAVLLAVFGGLFLLGIGSEESASVMTKAVNICLECIGIG